MADLEHQLRRYATGVLEPVDALRADDIMATEHLARGRRGRSRVAIAVAASVLLVGSGAVWIAARGGGDQVRVTSQTGASSTPTQWTQTASLDTQLSNITAVPGGLVATGYGGIWFSSDAHNWKNMLTPELPGGGPPYVGGTLPYVSDVVVTSHGLVAVGGVADPGTSHGVAAVWTSADGQTWTRVRDASLTPSTPPIPAGDTSPDRDSIAAVVRGGPGLVALGEVFSGTFNGPTLVTSCCTPTVWTSRDGSTWTRIDKAGDPGRFIDAVVRNGTVFAVASTVNGTDVSKSNDGAHWQHVGIVRGSVSSITVHGNTLVAVGSEPAANSDARAAIWTSTSGVTWRRVFAAPPARITSYNAVTSDGHWIVAVGYRGRYEVNTPGLMTISKDARHWTTVRRDAGAFAHDTYLSGVAAIGRGFVAIGTASTGAGTASDPVRSHTVIFASSRAPARAATSTRAVHDGASSIGTLAARPLRVARLGSNEACPQASVTNRIDGIGPMVESGPVAASVGDIVTLQYGTAHHGLHDAKILWLVRVEQAGPVIVRGTRIDGKGAVRWGNNGANPVLALTGDATSTAPPEWRDIPSAPQVRGSGCYAFQVDGTDFQSIIIFRAEPTQ